jgi:hypothetical protein
MIRSVSGTAKPAEFEFAIDTGHVVTSIVLFNWRRATRTLLNAFRLGPIVEFFVTLFITRYTASMRCFAAIKADNLPAFALKLFSSGCLSPRIIFTACARAPADQRIILESLFFLEPQVLGVELIPFFDSSGRKQFLDIGIRELGFAFVHAALDF